MENKDPIIEFLRESNAIEGVYSSEMLKQALYAWEYMMSQDRISPQTIKKVHKILMLHSNLKSDEKGYYRKVPVWIAGHEAILSQRIAEHLSTWCKEMNIQGGKSYLDKELDAKFLHIQYEKIHPFIDGNGRTGRIFMNWHRIKKLGLPLLTIYKKDVESYYKWFN